MKKILKTNLRKHANASIYDASRGTSFGADNWRARANSKPLTVVRIKG